MKRFAVATALLLGLPGLAWAQAPAAPASAATAESVQSVPPSETVAQLAFDLSIDASDEIKQLLQQHLQLLHYRQVPDLTDSELTRLLSDAQHNAQDLLATLGYFSPEIRFERLTVESDAPTRRVKLSVTAGAPTLVSELQIVFKGPIASDAAALLQRQRIETSALLRAGMRFTQARWDATKMQALRQLTSQRYPTGYLGSTLADIDPQTQRAHLHLTLESGPAYQLGTLVPSGLQRYDADLVTRLARLKPGTAYSQAQLVAAQQRLVDSGYFDSALVTLDTSGDPLAAPVMIKLREAQLQKLVLGIGASTDSGARLSVEHTHHQLPVIGWRAVSKLALDRQNAALGSELTAPPDADNWRWVGSALLQNQQMGSRKVGSERLRAGRGQSGEQIDRNYYLQYDRADGAATDSTDPVPAQALSANYAFAVRHFDSLPFPSEGWALGLEVGGGSTLGRQRDAYGRVLASWQGIWPLRGSAQDHSAALNDRATSGQRGGRIAVRAQTGAVLAKDAISLPSTQLFLTGGDNSVRGYGLRTIGITLADGQTSAGRYLMVGSVEWQRPIRLNQRLTDWESALFIDAGAVADKPAELRAKVGVGAGLRWNSPVGPLQIDLAYGVAVQRFRLHLTLGFTF